MHIEKYLNHSNMAMKQELSINVTQDIFKSEIKEEII